MAGESGRQLKFDIEDLYATVPAFHRAAGDLADALQKARSRLEGLGNFWGHDKLGESFGKVYQPSQERLFQLMNIVDGAVDGVADGITRTADTYGEAERDNVSKSESLREGK